MSKRWVQTVKHCLRPPSKYCLRIKKVIGALSDTVRDNYGTNPRALEVSWDEAQLTWVPDSCRTIWLKSTWDEVPALAVGRGVLIVTAVLLRTLD